MRILHTLAPAPFGGLERVVRDLAGAQTRIGHAVLVSAVGETEKDVRPFLNTLSPEVEGRALLVPTRAYRRERRSLRRICNEWGPTVLHTHGYRPDVVHGGVGRRLGLGPVTTVHGFSGTGLKNRLYEWLQCRVYRRFGAVVAVSPPLGRELERRGVPGDRIHVIPNALEQPTFLDPVRARDALGAGDATNHVGWIGRLGWEKGPDVLLEALRRAELPHGCRVSVIGSGSMEEELHRFSDRYGLGKAVSFLGPVPDAARLFRGFDLIVLSSRSEGTPIVLLEAMAAGTPVLTTAVGGIPDVVGEEEAFLVPPNDPSALGHALLTALRRRDLAEERATRARERFEQERDPVLWAARYDDIYRGASLF